MGATFTPPVDLIVPPIYTDSPQGFDLTSHYRDVLPAMQTLMSRYVQGPRGRNVFMMADGSFTDTQPANWDPTNPTGPVTQGWNPFTHTNDTTSLPTNEQVIKVFWGGCANPVTDTEALALEAAGYDVDMFDPPDIVATSFATFTGTSGTATLSGGVTAQAGDFLIAGYVSRELVTIGQTSSFTEVAPQQAFTGGLMNVYYKACVGGETSITCTNSTSKAARIRLLLVRNVTALEPASVSAVNAGTVNTVTATCGAAPNSSRSFGVLLVGMGGTIGVISSASNGWIHSLAQSGLPSFILSTLVAIPSAVALSATETWGASQAAASIIATFTAAA